MRVVALISGGKDSCYNMVQCVAAGHEIVALANLRPDSKDELDSYMYQTVGHQGVELYATAMGLPLFRKVTRGVAVLHDKVYTPTPDDEVEDLYNLLKKVKKEMDIEAVAVGAVLSDYQRVRVENVCSRLGLVALAYLWRRDQAELLQEMIDCKVDAVIIKVAALGLDPVKHLGLKISEIQSHLLKMNEKYGLNVCGEGGEYETFTLDSPLFAKSVVIDDFETVIHSNDVIAPVGYLNFRQLRLVDKDSHFAELSLHEKLIHSGCIIKNCLDYISDIDCDLNFITDDCDSTQPLSTHGSSDSSTPAPVIEDIPDCCGDSDPQPHQQWTTSAMPSSESTQSTEEAFINNEEGLSLLNSVVRSNASGWSWFGHVSTIDDDVVSATKIALEKLYALVNDQNLSMSDLVAVCLYVKSMSDYTRINDEYIKVFSGHNPPVRVCVEVPLSPKMPIIIEAVAYTPGESLNQQSVRNTMHVQGISHWAPANIGPYSQAVRIGDVLYIAGQIGLVPGSMKLVEGGVLRQCKLSLRHISRIIKAMDSNSELRDVVQCVCYLTDAAYIPQVRTEWEKRTNNSIVDYVVVPRLPRDALVEWQVWVHKGNSRFEYEETGCVVGNSRVSLCRRWNYDNTVSAIVCCISTGNSSTSQAVSDGDTWIPPSNLNDAQLVDVFNYVFSRLTKDIPPSCAESAVCSIRIFHKTSNPISPSTIYNTLSTFDKFNIVPTIVPVNQLNHPNTYLSICALRHS